MTVVAIGTMALILILSVFNGLEDLIASLYNSVEPDIVVSPAKGKYIDLDSIPESKIKTNPSVAYYSKVLEDMALVKYSSHKGESGERQLIVQIKGVSPDYRLMSGIDTMVYQGNFLVEYHGRYFAVFGGGVASKLGLRLTDFETPVYFYYPRAGASPANPMDAFNIESALPAGIISVQQEVDDRMVYVSFNFASKLMNISRKATSLEMNLNKGVKLGEFINFLKTSLGDNFKIKDRRRQNETIYKITQSEKWSGFLILSFILLIAVFNVVGSVTVLILEKKQDIKTFYHMGFTSRMIKKVFLYEGMMISVVGGAAGLILGLVLVLLQQRFGLIPMEGSFAVTSFPVALKFTDFVAVYSMVIAIGFGATILPVNRIAKSILKR